MNQPLPSDDQPSIFAVLTGDVIASSKMHPSDLKNVMKRLREGAARFKETFREAVYGQLDIFSGDGWQLLMPDRKRSLRAALFLRAMVKSYKKVKVDTRVAIAWGGVNASTLNPDRISESTGDAFTESGRGLRGMKKQCRLVWIPGQPLALESFLKSAVCLLDELTAKWTQRQAETVALALLDMNQEQVATTLGTSQPTVQQALRRAGWTGIQLFLNEIEYSLKDL